MTYEKRIVEAFRSSEIERVLLIDDAYDPPRLEDAEMGDVADLLQSKEGQALREHCEITPDTWDLAAAAADAGNASSPELEDVFRALYEQFVHSNETRFEPGDIFSVLKGGALAALRPLETLMHACGDLIRVKSVGLERAKETIREFRPHVLFLDYYLSDEVSVDGWVEDGTMTMARQASLALLKELVVDGLEIPAIVLMSSRPNQEIDGYRQDIGGQQILSVRFQFLHKQMVRQRGKDVIVDHDAAAALLDTSQGFVFGRTLQKALEQWRIGAEAALTEFMGGVRELQMKDFAYLLRFRLREDGQPFGEYLEWFFGECLKGVIEEKVDWQHSSFASIDDNPTMEEAVEGAYDGPSDVIADLFHRVRVSKDRGEVGRDYRFGDLYAQIGGDGVRAVITPDCDLVVRDEDRKAKSVLTMVGRLATFDQTDSAADDFLIRDGGRYSVRWNPKHLETFATDGVESLVRAQEFEYVGRLRPPYADAVQRRALNDLARGGLPVAPAFGLNVPIAVWIRLVGKMERMEVNAAIATVIPARSGGKGGPRVLLRRSFVYELVDQLAEVDIHRVGGKDLKCLRKVLTEEGINELHDKYLRNGAQIQGKPLGIGFVLGDVADESNGAPWLQIGLKVSDEARETVGVVDPVSENCD